MKPLPQRSLSLPPAYRQLAGVRKIDPQQSHGPLPPQGRGQTQTESLIKSPPDQLSRVPKRPGYLGRSLISYAVMTVAGGPAELSGDSARLSGEPDGASLAPACRRDRSGRLSHPPCAERLQRKQCQQGRSEIEHNCDNEDGNPASCGGPQQATNGHQQ